MLKQIKSNQTERHFDYNGRYAGYISIVRDNSKPVYYAYPVNKTVGRLYASLKLAKECLIRHAISDIPD